jgi:hypothetical protein
VVAGRESEKPEQEYLHRGIAARDFELRFSLADFVEVKDASFEDGLPVSRLGYAGNRRGKTVNFAARL